jgi:hypothetical protein
MDSLGDFIYIIIGMAILIASLAKRAKNAKKLPKDVLEDIFPVPGPVTQNDDVKQKTGPIYGDTRQKSQKPVYTSYENTEPVTTAEGSKEIFAEELPPAKRHEIIEGFDLQTAVIYSEILKVKYF